MFGFEPEVSGVFPHVDGEVMLPLGDVSTLCTHEVLVLGVNQHVFGQVGLVSAPELTQAALVRFLTCREKTETQSEINSNNLDYLLIIHFSPVTHSFINVTISSYIVS